MRSDGAADDTDYWHGKRPSSRKAPIKSLFLDMEKNIFESDDCEIVLLCSRFFRNNLLFLQVIIIILDII